MLSSLFQRAIRHRTPGIITQFGLTRDSLSNQRKNFVLDDPEAELREEESDDLGHDAFGFPQDNADEDIRDSYCLTMTQQEPSSSDDDKNPVNMSYFEERDIVSVDECCYILSKLFYRLLIEL